MKRKTETFSRWDAADHLHTEEDIVTYLQACANEDDPQSRPLTCGGEKGRNERA